MSTNIPWAALEPDLPTVLAQESNPLQALAEARIPAIVLRGVFNPLQCQGLLQRFIDRGLMRDPAAPRPTVEAAFQFQDSAHARIDIGTSLVNRTRGNHTVSSDAAENKEAFLQHAAATHDLFAHLFDGFDNPVTALYDCLAGLALDKQVSVAREPDGRRYGPAIFRIHYTGYAYQPHINHVAIDDQLYNFAVSRFRHQFAGLLCLQNASGEGKSPQAVVYRCPWDPTVQTQLDKNRFPAYVADQQIDAYQIDVQPGDFYLFNSGCIHQVAAVPGTLPRAVLATFIGYSDDDDDIFVWA